ncbi:MAG: hypothetical protein ABIK08_01230 [Pseudomonadota bacterium]
MAESTSTATDREAERSKANGEPRPASGVISIPQDVEQLVMVKHDQVGIKKDGPTVAVKGAADIAGREGRLVWEVGASVKSCLTLFAVKKKTTMKYGLLAISLMVLGGVMSAEAGLFGFGGDSWKEEVLLHDGSKIIVKRSQSYGGRHEIGQKPPVKEQELTFTLPNSNRSITWKSEYSEDIGRANLNLLALHVLNDTPYVVAEPNLCLAYNKWGRPNPPYVFFKYDGKVWQRISLTEFPAVLKKINLVVSTKRHKDTLTAQPVVTAKLVSELNGELEQPEYRAILREPVKGGGITSCEEMVRVKDGWVSPGGARAPTPVTPSASSDVKK